MNINNWLCKFFDGKKRGYVTVGDIMSFIINISILLLITLILLFGLGLFLVDIQGIEISYTESPMELILIVVSGFVLPVLIIISIIIFWIITSYVLSIKVAKCPKKEKDEEET